MLSFKTERLILRDFMPDDFRPFYKTTKDPIYQQFYAEAEMSEVYWQQLFDRILDGIRDRGRENFQLAVCLPAGEVIGTCAVRIESAEHQQASFGCAIARAQWGKGLATEASRRLLDYAFSSLPIHRIYAEVISENIQARSLAERLGMQPEGELRQNRFFRGRWWNTAIFSIFEQEWRRSTNS